MRREIAQFLQTGQEAIARIRVEHVVREQNVWAAYEILELFCEFVLARVPVLEGQKECPPELREAVASIIFAAPRCSDLPDLLQIKNLFSAKYGKEFVLAATELRPDTSVNRALIEKLSVSAPSAETRLKLLKEIAQEYNLDWDSSKTEAEFSKKHEDLLDGSKQICVGATLSQAPTEQSPLGTSPSNGAHPIMPTNNIQGIQHFQPPTSASTTSTTYLLSSYENEPLVKNFNAGSVSNGKSETQTPSFDILERARVAIASAERASAAARAAAELANVKFGSWKLDDDKTSKT